MTTNALTALNLLHKYSALVAASGRRLCALPLRLTTAAAITGLLASGCVPVSESYFQPSAPGGKAEPYRGACGGAPDHITFQPENFDWVAVRFSTIPPNKSVSRPLIVEMTIRKNVPYEFLLFPSVEAQRERAARSKAKREQAIAITASSNTVRASWAEGGFALLPIAFFDEKNQAVLKGGLNSRIEMPEFSGDWLLLEPPALSFDGVWLELPAIRFSRTEGTFMAPINC